jgi:hypothetical protein
MTAKTVIPVHDKKPVLVHLGSWPGASASQYEKKPKRVNTSYSLNRFGEITDTEEILFCVNVALLPGKEPSVPIS